MSAKKKHPEPEESPKADTPTEGAAPGDPLAAKTRECEELLDRLKRTTADFLNYQKRAERQMGEVRRFAIRDLLLDLLPVLDNLERALAHAETHPDFQSLQEGIRLVREQFTAALAKHGVERIEAEGRPFDPEHHEAVAHLPNEEHPEGHVAEVVAPGYRLHDQTLRPSRVTVSKGPEGKVEPESKDKAPEANGTCPDEPAEN